MFFRKTWKNQIQWNTSGYEEWTLPNRFWQLLQTYLVTVCFTVSAVWMLRDVFPEMVISSGRIVLILVIMAPLILTFTVMLPILPNIHTWVRFGISVVYLLGLCWYFLTHREQLLSGLGYLGGFVIKAVNFYYQLNLPSPEESSLYGEQTLVFLFFMILTIFLTEALWCEKRVIVAFVPAIVLVMDLSVGYAPGLSGIVLFFAGILLSNMGQWESRKFTAHGENNQKERQNGLHVISLIIAVSLVGLIPFCCNGFLREKSIQMAENGSNIREFQNVLEKKFSLMESLFTAEDQENVNNRTPNYMEDEVLRLSVDQKPQENIYLRGFYGTDYVDGSWKNYGADFEKAWEEAGFSEAEIENAIIRQNLNAGFVTYQLEYTNLETKKVFVPYLADLNSVDDSYQMIGENILNKPRNEKQIQYRVWNMSIDEFQSANESLNMRTDVDKWYTEYVYANELNVSDSVKSAGNAASIISALDSSDTFLVLNDPSITDTVVRNEAILEAAEIVRSYMEKWKYSLTLDRISDGTDAVEYFLAQSHSGYCMHYASAGVMILREMGIPARYASGYLVKSDNFTLQENLYTASILDSDAHAWVEVYLEDVGWVPVEMTPGFTQSDSALDSHTDSQLGLDIDEQVTHVPETSEQENQGQDSGKLDDPNQQEEHTADSMTEKESNTGLGTDAGESSLSLEKGTGGTFQFFWMIIILILLVLLTGGIFVGIVGRRNRLWKMRLQKGLEQRKNRMVVNQINSRIYRLLCKKGHFWKRQFTDAEYKRELMLHFPQGTREEWEHYMDIVQKMAFSWNEICDEEAEFCYEMYRRLFLPGNSVAGRK